MVDGIVLSNLDVFFLSAWFIADCSYSPQILLGGNCFLLFPVRYPFPRLHNRHLLDHEKSGFDIGQKVNSNFFKVNISLYVLSFPPQLVPSTYWPQCPNHCRIYRSHRGAHYPKPCTQGHHLPGRACQHSFSYQTFSKASNDFQSLRRNFHC